jgi:predicted transcriptional regulator
MQAIDSARLVSKHTELENLIRRYYISIEEDIKKDLGVSEASIVEHVQSLINNGYVEKPAVLIVTADGPRWVTVDYATYKEFMTDHAIISRRFHGVQPSILDSSFMDSIRSNILEISIFGPFSL